MSDTTGGNGGGAHDAGDTDADEFDAGADTDERQSARSAHPDADAPNRRRAALATLPFLLLGLAVAVLAVAFAPQPLWGFLLLPPVAFMAVLTYLTFRSDFLADR